MTNERDKTMDAIDCDGIANRYDTRYKGSAYRPEGIASKLLNLIHEAGMQRTKDAVPNNEESGPIIELLDLFVFKKARNQEIKDRDHIEAPCTKVKRVGSHARKAFTTQV